MFMEISKQYSVYIKYYMNTCNKTDILVKARKGFAEEVSKLSMPDILKNYEYFEGLSTQIFDLFQHANFCKQTRLFSNVVFMLLKDLMEIYRIYYQHITEILERFPSLGKREAQKAFVMYQNFVNLTEAIKNKANKLIYIFNFPITLPEFYTPEKGLIDTLRVVVSNAGDESQMRSQSEVQKINQVSAQLRSGMNNEQFEEKKGEDLDTFQNVYFDCNALDRLTEIESQVAGHGAASDPSEELKMDKDLGLFEMINASDFSTLSGAPNAAAGAAAINNNQFNFDGYNESVKKDTAAGQSADDFFGFGASAPKPTPGQDNAVANDLLDVFSTNAAMEQSKKDQPLGDALADIFAF